MGEANETRELVVRVVDEAFYTGSDDLDGNQIDMEYSINS